MRISRPLAIALLVGACHLHAPAEPASVEQTAPEPAPEPRDETMTPSYEDGEPDDPRRWYVGVGNMSAMAPSAAHVLPALRDAVVRALGREDGFVTSWPTGQPPTQAELREAGMPGFFVDASVVALTTRSTSGGGQIDCKVEITVATFPAMSGFAQKAGSAIVSGGASTAASVAQAEEECVTAVAWSLINKKIAKSIRGFSGTP